MDPLTFCGGCKGPPGIIGQRAADQFPCRDGGIRWQVFGEALRQAV
jgi:hypothetical protein